MKNKNKLICLFEKEFITLYNKIRNNLKLENMNARQAAEQGAQLVKELLESAILMSERTGKTVNECIDHKVNYYVRKSNSTTEAAAWEIRGEEAKKNFKIK